MFLEALQQFCEYVLAVIEHGVNEPLAVLVYAIMGVAMGKGTKFAMGGVRRMITSDQGNRVVQLIQTNGRVNSDTFVSAQRGPFPGSTVVTTFNVFLPGHNHPSNKLRIETVDKVDNGLAQDVTDLFTRLDKRRIRKAAQQLVDNKKEQERRALLAKI